MKLETKKRTSGAGRKLIIAILEAGDKGIDIVTLTKKVYGNVNDIYKKRLKKLITVFNCRYDVKIKYDRVLKIYFWNRSE